MPTYRVGVVLTASGASFQRGFGRAQQTVGRTDSALRKASGSARTFGDRADESGRRAQSALRKAGGSARAFGDRADESGRRAQSALQRASGSAGQLQSALRRTSNQARRTGDAIEQSTRRSGRRVQGLIERFRELRRTIKAAGDAGQTPAAGGAFGGGALRRAVGYAGGGYALSRAAGQELAIDDRFNALAIEASKSDEEMTAIRRNIEAVAGRDDIRVSVDNLLGAVEEYTERTGDLDQALQNLETTAQIIQRAGGQGRDFGRVAAQLRKFGIYGGDDYRTALITMIEAQREGALYARDLARSGGEALSAWVTARGEQGMQAWKDFLLLGQLAMVGTSNPETAMTSQRALVATFQDQQKIRDLEELGVYDVAERPVREVLEEAVAAVDGHMEELSHIFGEEARKLVGVLMTPEGQDVARRVGHATANIDEQLFNEDTARRADQATNKIQVLRDETQSLFSRLLGGPMEDAITTAFAFQDLILAGLTTAAAGYGAWRGGRAILRGGRRLFGRRGDEPAAAPPSGRRGRGGALPVPVGGPGLVRTMHVTTLIAGRTVGGGLPGAAGGRRGGGDRGGGLTGGPGGRRGGGDRGGGLTGGPGGRRGGGDRSSGLQRAGGRAGLPSLLQKTTGRGLGVVSTVLGLVGTASALAQGDTEGAARVAGGTAGGIGGAAAGAAVGTALLPGIGTFIGGVIGSIAGGLLGDAAGRGIHSAAASAATDGASHITRTRGRSRLLPQREPDPAGGVLARAAGETEPPDRGASHITRTRGRSRLLPQREPDPAGGVLARAAGETEPPDRGASHITRTRGRSRLLPQREPDPAGGVLARAAGETEPPDRGASHITRTRGRSRLFPHRKPDPADPIALLQPAVPAVHQADNRVTNTTTHLGGVSITIQAGDKSPTEIADEVLDAIEQRLEERRRDREENLLETSFSDPDDTAPVF